MKKYYEPDRIRQEIPLEPIPEEVRVQYLRPGELLSILEAFPVAYQPLGTLEWHGRHNPLGVDALKAEAVCVAAAKACGGAVMPPIYFATDAHWDYGYGVGYGMDSTVGYQLPGSFYEMPTEQFKNLLIRACTNYLQRGFKLVVLVSGHNPAIQQNTLDEVCYVMKTAEGAEPVIATMDYTLVEKGDPHRSGDHAAGCETSLMLHLHGDRVRMDANDGHERVNLGIMGDFPFHEATAEEGKARFKKQTRGLIKLVQTRLQGLM